MTNAPKLKQHPEIYSGCCGKDLLHLFHKTLFDQSLGGFVRHTVGFFLELGIGNQLLFFSKLSDQLKTPLDTALRGQAQAAGNGGVFLCLAGIGYVVLRALKRCGIKREEQAKGLAADGKLCKLGVTALEGFVAPAQARGDLLVG